MNYTLLALSSSLFSISPLYSITNYKHPVSFNFQKMHSNCFFSNFISSHAKTIHATFFQSSFSRFLNSPLFFNEDETVNNMHMRETFSQRQEWGQAELFVISCTFESCTAPDNSRGGAIHFVQSNSKLTVHGCTFDKCTAADGGGLFACADEQQTNADDNTGKDVMTHGKMPNFNSQYCCYSFCTSKMKTNDQKSAGYGSAVLVAADNINLNYSSTYQCPSKDHYDTNGDTPSYGAQFDLKTKKIDSCNINATSGYSIACSAIEYRDAESGTFKFQTVVDQKGAFITSFTRLNGEVEISYCNFVDNTINYQDFAICAAIHVRIKTVTIDNFCFSGLKFENYPNDKLGDKRIASKGGDKVTEEFYIKLQNCKLDTSLEEIKQTLFIDITATLNEFPEKVETQKIEQLKLGYCEGEEEPPRTFETNYFSNSDEFSHSTLFTNSNAFTESNVFSESNIFSESHKFTKSLEFTASTVFIPPPKARGGGKPIGAIAGGTVGGVAALALIAFLIFYFVRKSKLPGHISEDVETISGSTDQVENKNPLYNNAKDDPFQEDFD